MPEIALNPPPFKAPDLTGLDLTQLTPYAVQLRYDPEFWLDQSTATEAIKMAEQVRAAVLAVLPQAVHPQRTNACRNVTIACRRRSGRPTAYSSSRIR